MVSYAHLLAEDHKPIPAPRLVLAGAVLMAASFTSPTTLGAFHIGLSSAATWQDPKLSIGAIALCESEAQGIIDRINDIVANSSLRDEDEAAPIPEVVAKATALVNSASATMLHPMPRGVVSTFFGELNVAWRNDDEVVRVAFFPNRSTLLQYGSLSGPLGSYNSETNPTGEILASHLDALAASIA